MGEPVVFNNGLFWELRNARVSVLDRGFCYGDGVFETMRAYDNRIFRLEAHLDRLYRSLNRIFIELPLTCGELENFIHETLNRNGHPDAIIRLTVTRGEQTPTLRIDPEIPPTLVIYIRPFQPIPKRWYLDGVSISIYYNTAVKINGIDKQVKSLNYLSQIILRERTRRKGSLEALMMNELDEITEGTTCNIFIVKKDVLMTPMLNEYVLPGITRAEVLEIARKNGIKTLECKLSPNNVYEADEVFLTNTGFELLPVRKADDKKVGNGIPGPVTRYLHQEFLKNVAVQS